jgi:hypothetical protein
VCIEIRKPSLLRTMQVMPTSAYRTGYEGIKVWQLCPLLRRTGLASENPGLARIHLVSCRLSPMCFPWSKPSIPEADSSLCTPSPLLHPAQPPPLLYSSILIKTPIHKQPTVLQRRTRHRSHRGAILHGSAPQPSSHYVPITSCAGEPCRTEHGRGVRTCSKDM